MLGSFNLQIFVDFVEAKHSWRRRLRLYNDGTVIGVTSQKSSQATKLYHWIRRSTLVITSNRSSEDTTDT